MQKNSFQYRLRVVLVVFMIAFVSLSYYAYQMFFSANFQFRKEPAVLYIHKDMKWQQVLDTMKTKEMFGDLVTFAFVAKVLGYQDNVRPGRYLIPSNGNNLSVVRMLRAGQQAPVKLSFNNIRLKKDLVASLASRLAMGETELYALLNNPQVCKELGCDTTTILTLFIPNTYEMFWTISPTALLKRMKKESDAFWNESRKAKAQKLGLTPAQAFILASIVDEETNQNDEMPRVAGVYLNRLDQNMKLQADPTVKFALGDFAIKRVTFDHLKTDSPYNTYLYTGLPPGPICLPSTVAIDAVLNREAHSYLFFSADPSRPGYHAFSTTFNEHVKKANDYRSSLDKRKIR